MENSYLNERINKYLNFLRASIIVLAYIAAVLFGIALTIIFIVSDSHASWVWICLLAIILISNIANYFLSLKYRDRFYSWSSPFLRKNPIFFLFFPPFSTFFLSFGLAIFILKFFSKTAENSWQEAVKSLPEIYKLMGSFLSMISASLLLLPIVIGGLLLGVFLIKRARSKVQETMFFILAVIIFFFSLFILISPSLYPQLGEKFDIVFEYSIVFFQKVTGFLVSFSPIYLFYFLFISQKRSLKRQL